MQVLRQLFIAAAMVLVSLGALSAQENQQRFQVPLSALGKTESEAFLRLSQIALRGRQYEAAFELSQRAYGGTENNIIKFEAAFVAVQANVAQGRLTAAQLWLRRADQVAPNDRAKAIVARTYRQVARANPLNVQLQFNAAQSDNVNNGYDSDYFTGGISSDEALDGTEAEFGANLTYRLSENRTERINATARFFQRRVWLSEEAKLSDDAQPNSSYEYSLATVGIQFNQLIWPDLGVSGGAINFGKSWYGREDYTKWTDIGGWQNIKVGDGNIQVSANLKFENSYESDSQDARAFSIGTTHTSANEKGLRRSIGLSVSDSSSDSLTRDWRKIELRGSHALGDIGPFRANVSASASSIKYKEEFFLFFESLERQEQTFTFGVNATLPDAQFFGFVPKVNVSWKHVNSSISIYNSEEFAFGLTAQSRF